MNDSGLYIINFIILSDSILQQSINLHIVFTALEELKFLSMNISAKYQSLNH
jgi:hypothetical protein